MEKTKADIIYMGIDVMWGYLFKNNFKYFTFANYA